MRGRLALLLALAFLPAGVIAFQAGLTALSARDAAIQAEVGAGALSRLSEARDDITRMRETTRTLAASADLFADNRFRCGEVLDGFARDIPELAVLAVLDIESVIQCANEPAAHGQRAAAADLVQAAARRGDVVIGVIQTPRLTNEPVIAAVAPASMELRSRDFFVGVTRPLAPVFAQIRAAAPRPDGFAGLTTRDGVLLGVSGLDPHGRDAERLRLRIRQASAPALATAFELDSTWAVAMPLGEGGDLYLVEGWTPAEASWAGWLRSAWTLMVPILLWLAAVAATWFAIEYFVARPLLVVEALARSYARGEDSGSEEKLLVGAPVEISNLRRTLAAMAKTLRGREARLAMALQEERALLLEVNHRVKNNLQMVASILSIQARGSGDAAEARGLARAQDRVQLLALAHAHIYASGEVRDIALDQLASEIVRALVGARGAETAHVRLDLALAPVRASADRAVPLAFLIGESVACVFDLGGARVKSLRLALQAAPGNSFTLEIDAEADLEKGAARAATSQRLISAFGRQIGAVVEQDPNRPCYVRIATQAQSAEV